MLNEFRQAMFETCVNSEFEIIENDSAVVALRLAEVVQVTHTSAQEVFSLMFRGPAQPLVPQGTRHLRHAGLGELELFLVPVGQDKDGFDYEAVFNLLLPPS